MKNAMSSPTLMMKMMNVDGAHDEVCKYESIGYDPTSAAAKCD